MAKPHYPTSLAIFLKSVLKKSSGFLSNSEIFFVSILTIRKNKLHKNVLRISFSNETTWDEGKTFCEKLKNCIDEMSFLMPKKR